MSAVVAPLTARQQSVLSFIRARSRQYGAPPTIREIGRALGISSPNGVMCHLKALERKGHITRHPLRSRSIQLTESPTSLSFRGEVG